MKRAFPCWAALLLLLLAGPQALALDNLAASINQILDHRGDDFASLRRDPHGSGDETAHASGVIYPGSMQCYIAQPGKPHYSNECAIMETENRAILNTKYSQYVIALRDASPTSWTSWTEHSGNAMGETTYDGPDRLYPAAAVHWVLEGMNMDWYNLSVTFYGDGYTLAQPK